MMKFLVKQQKIEVLEREVLASDQIAFVLVKFVFDGAGVGRRNALPAGGNFTRFEYRPNGSHLLA